MINKEELKDTKEDLNNKRFPLTFKEFYNKRVKITVF